MGIQISAIVKLLKSTFFKRSLSDLSIDEHIKGGMIWLTQAQEMTPDDGVAARFSLINGWNSSYPETTGYIIPTFLKYFQITGQASFLQRAIRMAIWELSIQQKDGSFIGGALNQSAGPLVFDTGQIILGLLGIFNHTNEEKFLKGAVKAGNWLLKIQDDDGSWRYYSYNSIPHTYHSRVAWPLVELYKAVGEKKYLQSAKKHIEWVLANQRANGWYQNAGFTLQNNKAPYTHTIAYTIRGLLEIGIGLDEEQYIKLAKKTIDELIKKISPSGFLSGKFDESWGKKNSFSCLTGNAQISIICFKLYAHTSNSEYLDSALRLNKFLRSVQYVKEKDPNIHGAVAGSYPIWGEYERFSFPNWATKFFIDALILEKQTINKLESLQKR